MRFAKMLGLAAIAATTITAFAGTSTASSHWVGYCFQNFRLCPSNQVIVLAGWIHWIGNGLTSFEGALKEECKEFFAKSNEVKKELKDIKVMTGTLETVTFSGCKPCTTVKISGTPKTELEVMNEEKEEPKNWLMKVSEFSVLMEGCTEGKKCKFSGTVNGYMELSEEGSVLNTNKSSLKLVEGSVNPCGESTQWNQLVFYQYLLDSFPAQLDVIWPTIYV